MQEERVTESFGAAAEKARSPKAEQMLAQLERSALTERQPDDQRNCPYP